MKKKKATEDYEKEERKSELMSGIGAVEEILTEIFREISLGA